MKILIIAEIGVNHNGSLIKAKKLVDVAKKAGANFVKFQHFIPNELVVKNLKKVTYQKKFHSRESMQKMLFRYCLTLNDLKILKKYCEKKKINFLCSAFGDKSFQDLTNLKVKWIKIASGEITNYPLLKKIAKFNKTVFLSTGMSDFKEVQEAVEFLKKNGLKKNKIYLLHCTTQYPTFEKNVNLNSMISLKKIIGFNVGFSDHTVGAEAGIVAVTLGAKIIEKHITLSKKLIGPDHAASMEPNNFVKFVKQIRNVHFILGSKSKKPTSEEKKLRQSIRKVIVAKKKIFKNQFFDETNITTKRAGQGISAKNFYNIIKKNKAKKDYEEDEVILI